MRVAVTAISLVCPLGGVEALHRAIAQEASALVLPDPPGVGLPVARAELDVRPHLRRRKDRKLLSRAAQLAIPSARQALGEVAPDEVGVFLGVGREPPEDATEAAIVASGRDGVLDPVRLGAAGLGLYPPLASLRTLPNLILAHVAIQLGLRGPGGTVAGDGAAGLAAIVEGAQAVADGRCRVALAGGADSRVHPALVRDQRRRGGLAPGAGEAAAWVRLESPEHAAASGHAVLAWIVEARAGFTEAEPTGCTHWDAIGWCGAADGAVAAVLSLHAGQDGALHLVDPTGSHAGVRWHIPSVSTTP